MNRMAQIIFLMGAISQNAMVLSSEPLVLPVWPGKAVGDFGNIGPERVRSQEDAPTKDAKWITNVTVPTLHVFPSQHDHMNSMAVIVCPGGGYWNLAWDLEGEEVAKWLNSLGATAIVLKYRVPRRPGQPEALPAPGPLMDAQRAIRLVRSRATELKIDPNRIGIIGFSAGGHLAMSAATQFEHPAYESIDQIDESSCRPDFAAAIYPGYLVEQSEAGVEVNTAKLASYMKVPVQTPPIFLVHASDDNVAGAENSLVMFRALKNAGITTELHVYAHGGHGFGVRKSSEPCSTWTERYADWLHRIALLEKQIESAGK